MNTSKAKGSEALVGRAVSPLKAIRPLHDNVLLEVLGRGGVEEQMEGSALFKPAAAMDTTRVRGRVIAVGPGKLAYDAEAGTYERKPMSVQIGEEVTFELGAGTLLRVDGREFLMVTDEQLTGVVVSQLDVEREMLSSPPGGPFETIPFDVALQRYGSIEAAKRDGWIPMQEHAGMHRPKKRVEADEPRGFTYAQRERGGPISDG